MKKCKKDRALMGRFVFAILTALLLAHAQGGESPIYQSLRYEEDWSVLRDAAGAADPWDSVKYIPLGEEAYLSIGGDARVRYEYYHNPGFGRGIQDDNGYALQRYMLHGDLRLDSWWRAFGQLQHSVESGRRGGPRNFDENKLDIHQASVDVGPWWHPRRYTILRLGRQEVEFPVARLMSVRDGRNTRITFQGGRLIHQRERWRFAAWALRPVRINPKAFDDEWDGGQFVGGLAYTRYGVMAPQGNWVAYYSQFRERNAQFEQGSASEHRHTLGTRFWGAASNFDYNYEGAIQFGRFGDAGIRAWDVATDTGYTLQDLKWQPRLGLRVDLTSGDRDLADDKLENFNPLFAATAYSGLAGLIGPSNAIDVAPSVTLRLANDVTLTAGSAMFWRQSVKDGVYDLDLNLVRSGKNSRARFIGQQWTLILNWPLTAHASASATLSYFHTGRFLKESPPGEDVTYFTVWWNYRF